MVGGTDFADRHGCIFIKCSLTLSRCPSSACSAHFYFCGQHFHLLILVAHLGHLLQYNLSDDADILLKLHDLVRRAKCLLVSFIGVGPLTLTPLFTLSFFVCFSSLASV